MSKKSRKRQGASSNTKEHERRSRRHKERTKFGKLSPYSRALRVNGCNISLWKIIVALEQGKYDAAPTKLTSGTRYVIEEPDKDSE